PNTTTPHVPLNDVMETDHTSQTCIPTRPTILPPSSVFLTFLASVIGNPNNCTPDGTLSIDPNSLAVIQQMMAAEASHLAQMDKRMDQMAKLLESLETRLGNLENARPAAPSRPPNAMPGQKSYAKAIGA
ncbi:uncharacterized protein VP01_11182g1, partial [Puccinia sorghi]